MSEQFKIRALSSGAGWWMAFDEGGRIHFWPVLAFAAVPDPEDPEQDIIVGQTHGIMMDGAEYAQPSNLVGYYHESEFEVVGEKLKANAYERAKSGGY